jgi:long-chain acyl-CoA synthetase
MSAATETRIDSSIFRSFERLVQEDPERPAVWQGDETVTRRRLFDLAQQIAGELRALGLEEGQVVALQMRNSATFIASVLAAFQLRLTLLPLDRDACPSEVDTTLGLFGARAVLTGGENGRPEIHTTAGRSRIAIQRPIALIKLTSGSTGTPRGIATTEQNLIADCENICSTMEITPHDVNLGAIPFSHSYGFSNLVTPLLLRGVPLVASNDYLPLSILDLANRHQVSIVPGIPAIYGHLARLRPDDGAFRSVRTFISAGAPLSPVIAASFRERHGRPIHTFYGCSECGGIAYDREGRAAERGTVGSPIRGVQLAISPDSGRLVVESAAVAAGYLQGSEEEGVSFDGRRFTVDDLVEAAPDGEVRIVGRSSELINIAGKKVNPREVEAAILRIRGVREVKVFGTPVGERGEIVSAMVVAEDGVRQQEIRAHCLERLSVHKVPRVVTMIDELPVDDRGKVTRSSLLSS